MHPGQQAEVNNTPVWPGPLKGDPYKVLVVDDDPVCLKTVEQMLKHCNYAVTVCTNGKDALGKLRDPSMNFDLVLSDVYMPDMDGFRLLEHVGLELDLPVIMMSSNGETTVVLRGVTHGAVDFLIKPVRIEELRNVWQHVVRRKRSIESQRDSQSGDEGSDDTKRTERKRASKERRDSDETGSTKKQRVVWNQEMHQQFVEAVQTLGVEKAVPKKILELMPNSNLTRENVASHLQKYRAALKRGLSDSQTHPPTRSSSFTAQPLDMGNFPGLAPPPASRPAMELPSPPHAASAPPVALPPTLGGHPPTLHPFQPALPPSAVPAPFTPPGDAQLPGSFLQPPPMLAPNLLAKQSAGLHMPGLPPMHGSGLQASSLLPPAGAGLYLPSMLPSHSQAPSAPLPPAPGAGGQAAPLGFGQAPLEGALGSPRPALGQQPHLGALNTAVEPACMMSPVHAGAPALPLASHPLTPQHSSPASLASEPLASPLGAPDAADGFDGAQNLPLPTTELDELIARHSGAFQDPTDPALDVAMSQGFSDAIFGNHILQGPPTQGDAGEDEERKVDINDDMWKLLLE